MIRQRHAFPVRGATLVEYTVPLVVFFLAGTLLVTLTDLPTRFQAWISRTLNASTQGASLDVAPLGSPVAPETTAGDGTNR